MRILTHNITNPYFNLAAEEYFLTGPQEELVILWRNNRSVIVGKNQNTLEEINRAFVEEHKIPVVRRLTGGGAVFHDLGNLNYTLIQKMSLECSVTMGALPVPFAPSCKVKGCRLN